MEVTMEEINRPPEKGRIIDCALAKNANTDILNQKVSRESTNTRRRDENYIFF